MAIKNYSRQLQPREKAYHYGISSLSDSELLALILRNGTKEKNVIELSQDILNQTGGLNNLMKLSIDQCLALKGVGLAKATELAACLQLVKRISYQSILDKDVISNPELLIEWLKKEIGMEQQEFLIAVFLDNKNHIKSYQTIFKGVNNSVSFDPKTIFSCAIKENAHAIILAHNHPSQFVYPSLQDDRATNDLVASGEMINIPVKDHIIVSFDKYYSYKQHGLLKSNEIF